ncbi:MAG: DNA polymerase III subunit gamma and tau [Actinomycetia bacterium]|nr:DNA polymerase III subunit gamma and tau [Actinomycetes bacterium]
MALALYRTYRPSRLSEVIGQEHVTEPLARALSRDSVHHAFLFSGPRGCGKTSTARILARSLICEQGPTPDPCGECTFCLALAPNGPGLVDVIELDAASHGGVDDTRELRERAAFVPAQARFKVYIIDEAHMVTKDGFNALLKLIEEPPDHLKFIFATTEVDKVIPTIRSRTFNYAFRLVSSRQLQENLAQICRSEGVPFEPGALSLIARASGGSVRDAQSIMGQLIAGAGASGLEQAAVGDQLGVTDDALLDQVVEAIAEQDGAALFAAVNVVSESGHDVRRFVTDLLHQVRDLILISHAHEAANSDVLDVSPDRREVLATQAGQFGVAELTRISQVVNQGLTQIKGSTSPRLQLEILAARLLLSPSGQDPETLLARLETVERKLSAVSSGALPTPTAPGPARSAPAQASEGRAGKPTAGEAPPPARGDEGLAPVPPPDSVRSSSPETPAPTTPPPTAARPAPPPAPGGNKPPRPPKLASMGSQQPPAPPPPASYSQPDPRLGEQSPAPQADDRAQEQQREANTPQDTSDPASAGRQESSPPDADAASSSQLPPETGGAGSGDAEELQRLIAIWPDVIAKVRANSRVAAAAWESSLPHALADGALTIRVASPGQAVSIRSSRRDLAMHTLLIQEFGIAVEVNAVAVDEVNRPEDTPSHDDPDLGDGGLSGVDLAMRELGATKIGEFDGG